jgi:23S rRNA (uracil1939-C5)-methyltransferase
MSKQNKHSKKHHKSPESLGSVVTTFDLRIDSVAFGGKGVARHEGKVYFVEGGLEGDLATVEVSEANDRYGQARVVSLIEPSFWRGPSSCPVSERCGGCQWQGVPYEQQMVWKKMFVETAIRRIAKLGDSVNVEALPSPADNAYRNRIMVRARILADGRLTVGYFQRGSREFVAISRCAIAVDRINDFIVRLQRISFAEALASRPISSTGEFKEIKFKIELQDLPSKNAAEPHILLSVFESDDKSFPAEIIRRELGKLAGVAWIGGPSDVPKASFFEFESDLGVTFHTAPGLFQQVNVPHNHTVRRLVKSAVDEFSPKRVLDLFCGSGNLSLPLADGVRSIDGIEFSKRAIDAAKYNVQKGKVQKAQYFAGDTEAFLWKAVEAMASYDLIIADPPRDGMFKSLEPLMNLNPKHILYISCDPTTLARDLAVLCKRQYVVRRFVALDFFPNTYHIESFVILERAQV